MAKDRNWHHALAPTYVGDPVDCGLTVLEHAALEVAKALIIAKPTLIDTPDTLATTAATLAKTVLKRVWKEQV